MNTNALNALAGVICRAQELDRTPMGIAFAVDAAGMVMSPETAAEVERMVKQAVALRDQLVQAEKVAARAARERDLIRERVSEPYGCTHCGESKRSHGRQWMVTVGMHGWERPSDEQVKDRMLARRAARFTSHTDRLARLLVARTEELLAAEARISALESERNSTNESLDDAVRALRERETAPLTVFRASHDSIVIGLYTTRQAAYEHCEAYELRDDAVSPMAWNVDEDGVAELVRLRIPRSPGADSATGYVVTPVEVASEYDEEADE